MRSPVARARITDIDTGEALALDGVHAVFLAEDLNPSVREQWYTLLGRDIPDTPRRGRDTHRRHVSRVQLEVVSAVMERYRIPPEVCTPEALVVLMTAAARIMAMEDNLGFSMGHTETTEFMEQLLDRLESYAKPKARRAKKVKDEFPDRAQWTRGKPGPVRIDLPLRRRSEGGGWRTSPWTSKRSRGSRPG